MSEVKCIYEGVEPYTSCFEVLKLRRCLINHLPKEII